MYNLEQGMHHLASVHNILSAACRGRLAKVLTGVFDLCLCYAYK